MSTAAHKLDLSAIKANFIPGAKTFAYLAPLLGRTKTTLDGWKVGYSRRDGNLRVKELALVATNILPPDSPKGLRIPGEGWELEQHILHTFHHLLKPDYSGDLREVIRYDIQVVRWMQAVRRALHIK